MKLSELYSRNVEETLNPVVATGDLNAQTVSTEINEYVFTVDIVNGLYRTLEAIKNGSVNHNGIWVSGYFGSGKSHFLKYVSYCLRNEGAALARAAEAVKKHDPLTGGKSAVTPTDWQNVADWFASGSESVRTIMFNMGEAGFSNAKEGFDFLMVFWRKFNEMRGYSGRNLAIAYFLERSLDKAGKFGAYKEKIAGLGYDWVRIGGDITKLNKLLEAAAAVMPELAVDAVRESIVHNRVPLSVADFMADVKEWLDAQGKNCRLVFCVDEISQYINNRGNLLLQLQEIVTAFHNAGGAKVWLVCTAQQDMSEIASASGFAQTSDEFGKIMGRFPIMVQLSAASTEYITRKRVLDKTPAAAIKLGEFYDSHANEICAQYELPKAYGIYADRDDFIATYPFLGCHFRLMGQVLRAFLGRGFVVQNVKDNARSVLTLTLDVAKATRDCEAGKKFIAFDEFFSQSLNDGLTAVANSVIQNARALIAQSDHDKAFATRVLNTLFMICHLDYKDAQAFPATIGNLTSLMMTDITTSRKELKERIEAEVKYLCDESVLMRETSDSGVEYFKFYTKVEAEIDNRIKNLIPGDGDLADTWAELLSDCLGGALKPKIEFHKVRLSVGMDVLGRQLLNHKADVNIRVHVNSGGVTLDQFRLGNADASLVFFFCDLYTADTKFRDALYSYCKFSMFGKQSALNSQEEKDAFEAFRERARKLRTTCLLPTVEKFIRDAPVVSGQGEIPKSSASSAAKRYEEVLAKHLERLYPNARKAENLPHTAVALASDITGYHPPLPGSPLAEAEQEVEGYLNGNPSVCPVVNVVDYFKNRPYGWDEYSTLAALCRLVAGERREFHYNGAPNPTRDVVAANLAKNQAYFSIATKALISKETIEAFIDAIRAVFGHTALQNAKPQANELAAQAKEFLQEKIDLVNAAKGKTGPRLFTAPLDATSAKFAEWRQIADVKTFFDTVAAEASPLAAEWDASKQAMDFVNGKQWQKYLDLIAFADDNAENVQFLDDAGKDGFSHLVAAKDDTKPWSNLPNWIKIRNQTEAAFVACRSAKESQIDAAYSAAFDELEAQAESLGVDKGAFADRAATIAAKRAAGSLMALENEINRVAKFKEDETLKIIAAVPTSAGGSQSPATVKSVKLNVSHPTPLKNADDVENYLAGLRKQLMAEIEAGASVIVISG